jgi:hypothetical protein
MQRVQYPQPSLPQREESMARIGRTTVAQRDKPDEQDPDGGPHFWIRFRSGPSDLYMVMQQAGNRA